MANQQSLSKYLNELQEICKRDTLYEHALQKFPKFHMHDKFSDSLAIVDEKNWTDYVSITGMPPRLLNWKDEQWLVLPTSHIDREETDLSLYRKYIFCRYDAEAGKYMVWTFRASTGILFDENDTTVDDDIGPLNLLLEDRLYTNAKRAIAARAW